MANAVWIQTDYKIVTSITKWGMQREAKKLFAQGYTAQWGMQKGICYFYQAFVK